MAKYNLFDAASLVMSPTGIKDGKLYSTVPEDGSGDFTFSRDADIQATRVNSSGLIEKAKVNLLLQSNSFSSWSWTKSNVSVTGGQSGYDGSSDAWLLNKLDTYGRAEQSISYSGLNTISVYAKAGTYNWLLINDGTGNAYYDLANGVVGSLFNFVSHSIESVGGGWYRCSVVLNASRSVLRFYPMAGDNDFGTTPFGTLYIQDAALCHGLIAQDYVETTTTAVVEGLTADLPRLDYSGGASCPSLLLEPSRTNLFPDGELIASTLGISNISVTYNDTTSPEGVVNGHLYYENTNNSTHFARLGSVTAAEYSISIFAKAAGRSDFLLTADFNNGVKFDVGTGVIDSYLGSGYTADIEPMGNDWYRCIVTTTFTSSSTFYLSMLDDNGNVSYTGDGTSGLYLYGAQAEEGSYPTSYIPTYGTAANRGADSCSKTGISSLIGQTEGTLFLDFKLPKVATPQIHTWVALKDSAQDNRVMVYFLANSETLRAQIKSSGTANNFSLGTISNGDRVKIAIAYKSGDSAIYVNGISVVTSTDSLSFGTMDIIDFNDSTAPFEGNANQMLVFKTRLTNAELASLTTI